jgi:hypothetical protein
MYDFRLPGSISVFSALLSLSLSLSQCNPLSVKLWACPRKKEDFDFPTRKQGRACDGSEIKGYEVVVWRL